MGLARRSPVLPEGAEGRLVGDLEDDVDAPAERIAGHGLDRARAGEAGREVRKAGRIAFGKGQPFGLRLEPGRIADRSHLDRRLRAVDERGVHLRVRALRLKAPVLPHRVRRRELEARLVTGALARAGDREAGEPRPVDEVADERRLVAPGERVDDACLRGAPGEGGAGDDVSLDGDHHDVLAVLDRCERVRDAGRRRAGRLDDHVGPAGFDQRQGVRAGLGRPGSRPGSGEIEVGDPGHFETGHACRLPREHRGELAGSDDARPERPVAVAKLVGEAGAQEAETI